MPFAYDILSLWQFIVMSGVQSFGGSLTIFSYLLFFEKTGDERDNEEKAKEEEETQRMD